MSARGIQVGDFILGEDGNPERVVAIFGGMEEAVEIVTAGARISCSKSHTFLDRYRNCVEAGSLTRGDSILLAGGLEVTIEAVFELGLVQVYGWTCEPSHIYQAGGFLNHNKVQNANDPPTGVTAQ